MRGSGLPVRDNYASIEALGELIKQDLIAVLDKQFPEDQTPTPLEAEQNAHRSYARDRCQAYIANPRDIEALDAHFNTPTNNALLVTGESGLGKSALLAYWVNQQRTHDPDQFIIEHYVGISGDADPIAIIRRIMTEIKHRTDDNAELPSKPEDIIQDFPLWLAKVSERDPLLLIIEGLNQLESKDGKWLPGFWQENVKAIFSIIPGVQLDQLLQNEWPIHTLEALDLKRRDQLIREWLASYRKALSTEQTQRIAQTPQTGNPLFLKTVLEELRIFGYFEHLDERISTLLSADNPQTLFVLVLERLENDFGRDIVTQIMQALWAARRGLSETEIAGITGLSRLVISTFLMAIDAHLAKRGGLLNFFHDYLRQAVKQHCLENKETETHAHIKLAQYFEQQELNNRVAEELPWQWQQAEQWEALKDCISAIPMFEVLYKKDDLELLAYWLAMEDQFDPGECYPAAFALWEWEAENLAELLHALKSLGWFFTYRCVRLNIAEIFCRRLQTITEQRFGTDSTVNIFSLCSLGSLLQYQGNYVSAESMLRGALALSEKEFGKDASATAAMLSNLGHLCHAKGNNEEAEDLYTRALDILEKKFGINHPETASSLHDLSILLHEQDKYEEAELSFRNILSIYEKFSGTASPEYALVLHNLGESLHAQGNDKQAEPYYRQALAIREQVLGSDHPDTAFSLSGLAALLEAQGNNKEAESLCRRALLIREKFLGDHPYTAKSQTNLADLLSEQGSYEEAESLYRRALLIREQILGNDHPDTIQSINNLANMLSEQNGHEEAESLYRRALAIHERVIGCDHPDTANIIENLARLLQAQNNYEAAESLYHQVLAIREQVLGSDHLDTAEVLSNLADLLQAKGSYEAAEPLYHRVLAIREKALGHDHIEIAYVLNRLGSLLGTQGNYEDAEPLFRRALAINEKVLPRDHLNNITIFNNLARLLQNQGNYAEAESFYRRALEVNENVFGSDNPEIVKSIENLARLLQDQDKFTAAEFLYRRALAINEKVLGSEHPDTATSCNNLARLLQDQGNYAIAEPLDRQALAIREQILGMGHPDTSSSLENLAGLLYFQGNYDDAELFLRRALSINKKVLGRDHPETARNLDNLNVLINDTLSSRELLWKQTDFIIAAAYTKSITLLLGQTSLTFSSLLLGAKTANLAGCLEKPIEALSKYESQIQKVENNLGLTAEQIIIPILDRAMPMDKELKALLQAYRQSTLECLIDALIDRVF